MKVSYVFFISKFEGKEYYALRTHLGLVSDHAKELIEEKNFPEWLIKYPSMFPDAKKEYNPEEYLIDLNQTKRKSKKILHQKGMSLMFTQIRKLLMMTKKLILMNYMKMH